jgi:TorA maturation chaperone TorD
MSDPIPQALRILGRFWLHEPGPGDLKLISALPDLAGALPTGGSIDLPDLAVEYQRLFGFNLPPYESVFVDPSGMLSSAATGWVQTLYRQAGWVPPIGARAGAADHLGLELLAQADWLEGEYTHLAHQLHARHLALWAPAFVLALRQLAPHPFYLALGNLTLDLLLETLPPDIVPRDVDPFPALPPPAYATDDRRPTTDDHMTPSVSSVIRHSPPVVGPSLERDEEAPLGLRDILGRILTPCQAGVFLTRHAIAGIGRALDLPGVVGERTRMLEGLFHLAGQYEVVPALFGQLMQLLEEAGGVYGAWEDEYPAWTPYAAAWRRRVAATHTTLQQLSQEAQWQRASDQEGAEGR